MHILIVSSTFHPTIGGAESYALQLARGLKSKGLDVTVLTDGLLLSAPEEETLDGIRILRMTAYQRTIERPDKVRWEQMAFALLSEVAERLSTSNPVDLVHVNSQETAIWGTMLASHWRVPCVATFHEQAPDQEPCGEGRCKVAYGLPIQAIIGGSLFYVDRARRFAGPERSHLIYHGIDTEKFSPDIPGWKLRDRWGLSQSARLVLCSGRISPRKRQLELVQAFARVASENKSSKLVLAGSCNSGSVEYRDRIIRMVRELGLEQHVLLEADLTHDQMPEAYAAADLVVQPSESEGLGLALLEGMATGKPVVGTDVSGIREVIEHNETGVLVRLGEDDHLSEAIVHLLRDCEHGSSLGRTARARVCADFSLNKMIERTLALYRDLRARNSKGSTSE